MEYTPYTTIPPAHRTALQNQMPEILNLTTLQCSVVYNVGNSLVLVVTLVASIGDDITPTALVD